MHYDSTNSIFDHAVAFVNQTNRHIFLTGKAGTGKTTFLKYIREHSFKKMAVLAPTGVAAINAGGVTIHSFFQLPFGAYTPTFSPLSVGIQIHNKHTILQNIRFNSTKRDLIRELELLIIDEISMVRADMLDAVDMVLRHFRKQPTVPFGGVQLLYIGDLFQLPPVVKNEEWQYLQEYYRSPFFFDAHVIAEAAPVYIELKKIYRQTDDVFINLLNNVRNNSCSAQDIELLNSHYQKDFSPSKKDNYITLTSHNYLAENINKKELEKLKSKSHTFKATITGEFYERSYPVDEQLILKEGAQVMFIKNDKGEERRYYNGKIGLIKKITPDTIEVQCKDDTIIELEKEVWRNISYQYNTLDDSIEEEELGTFSHYPIRLAWAITIHKSQGLTFDKAIIDAGASFAPGQVYVALSRLTNLSGLVLHSIIDAKCISTDFRALDFTKNEMTEDALQQTLQHGQSTYIRQSLINTFNWDKLNDAIHAHHIGYESRKIPDLEKCILWSEKIFKAIEQQKDYAFKFCKQLEYLFVSCEKDNYAEVNKRTKAAAEYFAKSLEENVIGPVKDHINKVKIKKQTKKYVKDLSNLLILFTRKKEQLNNAITIVDALTSSQKINDVLSLVGKKLIVTLEKDKKEDKLTKGETYSITLEMFKSGKTIADIAAARGLATTTIEGHLCRYITTGEVDVLDLIENDKLNSIVEAITVSKETNASIIKEKVGTAFSYSEIKIALAYLNKEEATGPIK